jgi:tetratricopeptide (TPR) repeat protein
MVMWSVGGWHYCTGLIKLMRAERTWDPETRQATLKGAMGDILYSYEKISLKEPLAAEISVAYARALRLAKQPEKALQVLDKVRPLHPRYVPLYVAYTVLFFDAQDYAAAVATLEEGNRQTGDRIGELQYYLGLAYFKSGQIEQAREYEAKARQNRYPLHGLARLLSEHDAKQTSHKE